jgi:acyl-CoA synthetase (AMP-forming)/AMP-acid ligase II
MAQKVPEQIEIVDELPRNATGKVKKHELRARFAAPRA